MARDRGEGTEIDVDAPSEEDAELAALQAELDAEGEKPEGETEAAAKPAKAKSSKIDMPEGFGTPVDFTHYLKKERGVEVKPQIIYGHVKNSKTFQVFTDQHEDGRTRVDLGKALAWWDEKTARKAEKDAEAVTPASAEAPAEESVPA